MSAISSVKHRFSTLRTGSLHAKLTHFAFGGFSRKTKACPYWWVMVPTSLPVAGLKLIVLLILAVVCLAVFILLQTIGFIVFASSWICGFRPRSWFFFAEAKFIPGVSKEDFLLPYKKKLKKDPDYGWYNVEDVRFAPYQFIVPIVVVMLVALVITKFVSLTDATGNAIEFAAPIIPYVVFGIGVIAILTALGYIFKHLVVPALKRKYAQWCPPIEWVDETPEAAEAA